jgi:hypothetical protein
MNSRFTLIEGNVKVRCRVTAAVGCKYNLEFVASLAIHDGCMASGSRI